MDIPKAKEIIAYAQGIGDKAARLKFIELQMDQITKLNQDLWDHYSILACEIIYPMRVAAKDVCEYDWSDNDEDAVAAINALRASTHSR